MKTRFTKFFAMAIVLFAFSASAFSQVSATATATATIITPISIANGGDMSFGNIAVSGVAGTVVLTPASTRTATGGVTLPATTGTVTAAIFNVTGTGSATYSITLPSTPTTINSGGNTMTVDVFTSNPSGTGTLSVGGAQSFNVGATLNVGGGQASGTYLSAIPFTVTVNYN
jgi:hypothetical protein